MDLNKELSEFTSSYKNGGILTRVFLVLGFFFTLSSLTSLSSTIIEWKGFILNGINFYKEFFVIPVSSVASAIGFSYTETEIHVATVISFTITTGMRLLAAGDDIVYRKINQNYNSSLKPRRIHLWAVAVLGAMGIWFLYGIFNPPIHIWLVLVTTLFYPIFLIFPKIISSKLDKNLIKEDYLNYFKQYYIYMFLFVIVICIFAAVNTGLKETPNKNQKYAYGGTSLSPRPFDWRYVYKNA